MGAHLDTLSHEDYAISGWLQLQAEVPFLGSFTKMTQKANQLLNLSLKLSGAMMFYPEDTPSATGIGQDSPMFHSFDNYLK